ncbi:lysozyme family protein [Dongia rigui]|uniref:Transglycosylase SLT domain-containing protein n=1 Tax=Dongia rigui TaxID=940149 RepID=A0ABU5DZ19_9PROT|nr:hypothetical protein [Dongia rigui]MDY0872257.1 hypothetical protein [Dongia rigui]
MLPKCPFTLYYAYKRKHFGGLPMRPPAKKRIDFEVATSPADSRTEALQEKAKLAQHLHVQGVNPVRWTEAHPAPQSDQATFQKAGIKSKDNQFEVGGRLYDWSPAVTATPAQAKAIADAYVAERTGKNDVAAATPTIEELVDIAAVPLTHPLGTPQTGRPANDLNAAEERAALARRYGQSGVDPGKVHPGDPLGIADQAPLKRPSVADGGHTPRIANDNAESLEKETERFYREQERLRRVTPIPVVSDSDGRAACIKANGGCRFEVKDNPDADGDMPFYEASHSPEIAKYDAMIEAAGEEFQVDPDLIRAIMYMETTHGYYDKLRPWIGGENKSILPMNVNVAYWGDFVGDRDGLADPMTNIRAGARMLRAIMNNLPKNAPVSHIASLYNSHRAESVSNYGARVARIFDEKMWRKKNAPLVGWPSRTPKP